MTFTLTVDMDNAAFEEGMAHELRRILADISARLKSGVTDGNIRDVNGNRVGRFEIAP